MELNYFSHYTNCGSFEHIGVLFQSLQKMSFKQSSLFTVKHRPVALQNVFMVEPPLSGHSFRIINGSIYPDLLILLCRNS